MKQILFFLLFLTPFLSYAQGFTKDEYQALMSYMGDDHIEINKYLRRETKDIDLKLEEEILLISKALLKVNKYSRETYRGTCLPKGKIANAYLKSGNEVVDKAFMSTSKLRIVAEEFVTKNENCLPVLMIINGVNGADISEFAKYFLGHDSIQYEEEEVLFNHGTSFLVEGISQELHENVGEISVIRLKEL